MAREDRFAYVAAAINLGFGHGVTATVASLKRLDSLPDEILLVNDGSTDGSPQRPRAEHHRGVRLLAMGRNAGRLTPVRNRALRKARHRCVLLTDDGVTVAPDAVRHLIGVLSAREGAAIVLDALLEAGGIR